jgi:hypothetical protein
MKLSAGFGQQRGGAEWGRRELAAQPKQKKLVEEENLAGS